MWKMIAAAFAAMLATASAAAQDYPTQSITIVVPFAAGGPTDTVARLVGEAMSKDLGQQVVIENVTGAGGTIGAARVANAEPDGYTLLLYHIGMATSATLYRNLPYDTLNAFDYVGLVNEVPMVVVARKDFEPTDFASLVDYVKANKDTVTYANAGIGSGSHLCGMLFMSTIGTQLTTVPYQGTGPAMTDLLGGQVDFMCDQTTNATNQIQTGAIKAYVTTAPKRIAALPEIPAAAELGQKEFEFGVWHGLYAPKGTPAPAPAIERLTASLQLALKDPVVLERFGALGATASTAEEATPAALKAKLEAEIARWKPLIEAAGVYAD